MRGLSLIAAVMVLLLLGGCGSGPGQGTTAALPSTATEAPATAAPASAAPPAAPPPEEDLTVSARLEGGFTVTVTVQDRHYVRNSGEDPAFSAELTLDLKGQSPSETIYYNGFQWAYCDVVDEEGEPVSGLIMTIPAILSSCTMEQGVPATLSWKPSGEQLDAADPGPCYLQASVFFYTTNGDRDQQDRHCVLLVPLTIE